MLLPIVLWGRLSQRVGKPSIAPGPANRHGRKRDGGNEAGIDAFIRQFAETWNEFETWSEIMTYEPNDLNRRPVDEDYRSTADRPGTYTRNPSNTGVIGAIVGVLAVVAIVFFVWRGYDNADTHTGAANTSTSSTASTAAPSPRPATPVAPAPAAPDTTGTTTTAPRP